VATKQGDLALLDDPVAQELLRSATLARLAYVWPDGTPRVTPVWFSWNGAEIVVASPPGSPKLRALRDGSKVALTIDTEPSPNKVLLVRGTATIHLVDGTPPEYDASARRYEGEEAGNEWLEQVHALFSHMARIAIRPEWVGLLDFETRFPSAFASAMAQTGA
jgi:hypothetical protein